MREIQREGVTHGVDHLIRPAVLHGLAVDQKHHGLRYDMRVACHIIMQAQGAIDGPIESFRSPVHIVTPYNIPALSTM